MSLLQMSYSGAALILVITVIRAMAVHKLPQNTFLVLWYIVLVRLLVPFSIPSVVSIYSFFNHNTIIHIFEGTQISNLIPVIPAEQWGLTEEMPSQHMLSVSIWFIIWCMGMILCIVFFAGAYLHWHFQFRTCLPVHNSYVEQWLDSHRLKRSLCIRQSEKIATPLTYGILRPVIVMPQDTDWGNVTQNEYILLHEYVHIYRFDTVLKLIATLALCVHWFNPLVWVMYILFDRDIELSCDESVVRRTGVSEKTTYAKMLINMEAKKSGLMPFYNSFNKNAIEERIEAIMRMKKTTLLSLGVAVIVVAGITTTFATSAAENRGDAIDIYLEDTATEGDIDKYSVFFEYVAESMALNIKDYYEIADCIINISVSNGEIVSVDVNVISVHDETDDLKTGILVYVSKALGISAENITLSICQE